LLKVKKYPELIDLINDQVEPMPNNDNNDKLLDLAVEDVKVKGLFMEFGVASGYSINRIANKASPRLVYGFDSFKGLPRAWSNLPKGHFAQHTLPHVLPNVSLIVGMIEDTLPQFMAENPDPIAFMNIDVDLYESAKTILDCVSERLVPGAIVFFDEICHWRKSYLEWRDNEYKACQEWLERTKIKLQPLYRNFDCGVAFKIVKNPVFNN